MEMTKKEIENQIQKVVLLIKNVPTRYMYEELRKLQEELKRFKKSWQSIKENAFWYNVKSYHLIVR